MKTNKNKKDQFPGYPKYPQQDDIYNKSKEEKDLDPENPGKLKDDVEEEQLLNELHFEDDPFIDDELDVPGAELDDEQEDIGSEDEENNLYSLGGDKD